MQTWRCRFRHDKELVGSRWEGRACCVLVVSCKLEGAETVGWLAMRWPSSESLCLEESCHADLKMLIRTRQGVGS